MKTAPTHGPFAKAAPAGAVGRSHGSTPPPPPWAALSSSCGVEAVSGSGRVIRRAAWRVPTWEKEKDEDEEGMR
jgi:hypothetical protein